MSFDGEGHRFGAVDVVLHILVVVQCADVLLIQLKGSDGNKVVGTGHNGEEGGTRCVSAEHQLMSFGASSTQQAGSGTPHLHVLQVQIASIGKINFGLLIHSTILLFYQS